MKTAYTDSFYEVPELILKGNDVVVVEDFDIHEHNYDTGEDEIKYWCQIFVRTHEFVEKIATKTQWQLDKESPKPHFWAAVSFSVKGSMEDIKSQLEDIE